MSNSAFDNCIEVIDFQDKNKKKILKYIKLLYSKDSKLNEIDNFRERQILACKRVKLNYNDPEIQKILNYENSEVSYLINLYIGKIQNSNKYDRFLSDQWLFWSIQEKLRQPLSDDSGEIKKRTDLSKYSEELEQRIDIAKSQLYGTDEATQEMGAKIIRMSFEDRLRKLKDDVQADQESV